MNAVDVDTVPASSLRITTFAKPAVLVAGTVTVSEVVLEAVTVAELPPMVTVLVAKSVPAITILSPPAVVVVAGVILVIVGEEADTIPVNVKNPLTTNAIKQKIPCFLKFILFYY